MWLEKATNFTGSHTVVECGGYGYIGVNSSLIDMGGNESSCCFGRGGHVLYTNSTQLHLHEARQAQAEHQSNTTRVHTGSQWIVIDRAFATYLISDSHALRWQRVFQARVQNSPLLWNVPCSERPLSLEMSANVHPCKH